MRVLVTGATGLVGNNVVRLLLEHGHTVRVLTRSTSDPRPLEGLPLEQVQGDVRDASSLLRAVQGVEYVVHSAAHVQVGWSGLDVQRAINVEGTRQVAEAARSAGARMVHVSSVDALGLAPGGEAADETTPRTGDGPSKTPCPYVVTKRESEVALREVIARGLDAVIVNPGFMIGPWDWKPSSGKMLLGVASQFAVLAPTGGCSLCDVRDVAAGILSALARGRCGENYILAGYNLSYLELWRLFARISHSRAPWMRMGPLQRIAAGRVGDLLSKLRGRELDVNSAAIAMSSLHHYYCSAKAERELGYHNRPAEETVQDAWDWFREHGYA
jgi:dihydroflavonol-4-reductase